MMSTYRTTGLFLSQANYILSTSLQGERGGSVVECRTPEREVRGSRPTAAVLCPWARHFTPRKYWLITQEAMAPSRHDWKIVDWDIKPQHNQPTNFPTSHFPLLISTTTGYHFIFCLEWCGMTSYLFQALCCIQNFKLFTFEILLLQTAPIVTSYSPWLLSRWPWPATTSCSAAAAMTSDSVSWWPSEDVVLWSGWDL